MASGVSFTNNSISRPQTHARTCLCSPSRHPGSFRCSIHRNPNRTPARVSPNEWEMSMIKKVLLQIVKPSNHDKQKRRKRRRDFQPQPSRFCLMNGNNGAGAITVS
ncbi:uncharacterized protein LOC120005412 [Tripterygium wilfordii]|uniref:uncharacterized protein LOC120005412 n=1 Tax=Tripterygium wilfordii TaxID=458696 RepID=UPI0018F82E39|nr:uncharacterized protein LOC120005412 [Tripterygium wilfordii]